jgi:primosomal protein N'
MYVVEIIPLSRTAPQAPLSYRSATKLAPGALVSVPLRRKTVTGLVVDCVPVRESKMALKTASFSLSKSTDLKQGSLPSSLLEAAREVSVYHATTIGAVLSALLVPVLSDTPLLHFAKAKKNDSVIERVEAPFLKRFATYEKILDSKNGAVLLVVPTQTEAEEFGGLLKKYSPIVLSGKLSSQRREAALATAPTCNGLVISTPGFAWVPIENLDHIIIERVSAGSYTFPKRPYVDVRYALTALARARSIPILYGDYPLPLEYRAAPAATMTEVSTNPIEVFDVRTPKKPRGETAAPWQAVPSHFRDEIKKTLDGGGRVAVLAVRKGYSPTVVCGDCGTAVTDENGRTLSLASSKNERVFRSSDGSTSQSADVFCKVCGSWNLKPLGIGVERVEEELRQAFPDAPLVRITEDSRKTVSLKKTRVQIMEPGTIIVGTELMLPWLSSSESVELAVIASADSLLALPFWRSRERFVRVGLMLAERAGRTLIATRRPGAAAFTTLSAPLTIGQPHGDTFWKEESELRKILSYPPFGTLIVFHVEATTARLAEARESILNASLPYIPHELAERPLTATTSRTTLVLQLPDGVWPDKELSERLARLSPTIRISIDSETLW